MVCWRVGLVCRCNAGMLQGQVQMPVQSFPAARSDARSQFFSEQQAFWHLPLHEISAIVDVAVTKGRLPRGDCRN